MHCSRWMPTDKAIINLDAITLKLSSRLRDTQVIAKPVDCNLSSGLPPSRYHGIYLLKSLPTAPPLHRRRRCRWGRRPLHFLSAAQYTGIGSSGSPSTWLWRRGKFCSSSISLGESSTRADCRSQEKCWYTERIGRKQGHSEQSIKTR